MAERPYDKDGHVWPCAGWWLGGSGGPGACTCAILRPLGYGRPHPDAVVRGLQSSGVAYVTSLTDADLEKVAAAVWAELGEHAKRLEG